MQQRQPHRVVPATPNLVVSRENAFLAAEEQPAPASANTAEHWQEPRQSGRTQGRSASGSLRIPLDASAAGTSNSLAGTLPAAGETRAGGSIPPAGYASDADAYAGRQHYPPAAGSALEPGRSNSPPALAHGHSTRTSSVHVPLLADHDSAGRNDFDDDSHYRNSGGAGANGIGASRTPSKVSLLGMFLPKPGPRTRLHPFLLLPAFICGMLLTWSGRQTEVGRRIVTSTLVRRGK